jgi:hypothetical protein
MNKELRIEKLHPYLLIENELKSQKELYERLEPNERGSIKGKEAVFAASLPSWLRTVEDVRTWVMGNYK